MYDKKNIEASINQLMNIVNIGGIKLGKKGSIVFNDKNKYNIEANPINSKDSTGAGDMYAAGFLASLSNTNNYQRAGELGSLMAEEVIQIYGSRLSKNRINELKHELF